MSKVEQSGLPERTGFRRGPMLYEGFGLVQNLRPERMTAFITPEPDLFSVWHLGIPDVSADGWSLTLDGMVARPLRLTLADLRELPRSEITSVHECAGNPLVPEIPQRRVGNVRWAGVRLAVLLDLSEVHDEAAYVVSRGLDHGVFDSALHDRYEKDLPMGKARDGSVLVAFEINGEPLHVRRG